jgi:diacylglycerol O-acyltransferase / trehalose O-mycolyltransferase
LYSVLVVIPEGGDVGSYSNWDNHGRGGPPRWESFHLTELRELLEHHWRAGDRRAVAGPSMGGLGAMAYAARHPGMFRAAATYSGVLDTRPTGAAQNVQSVLRSYGHDDQAPWGDPGRDAAMWAAHNPYDLASRLRGVALFVSSGDGRPGPGDPPADAAHAWAIERTLRLQSLAFAARLRALGIPVQLRTYASARLAVLAGDASPVAAAAARRAGA